MTLVEIVALLAAHFVADFVLQSDKMARGKSTSNFWLSAHVLTYAAAILPAAFFLFWGRPWRFVATWWAINLAAHWITDWSTSRITARLYAAGERHWFFVVIGLDQLIHHATLLATWQAIEGSASPAP